MDSNNDNDATWDRLVDAVDLKFGIADHGRSTEKLEDHPDLTQKVQFVTFAREGTTYKMERITGPAIIDRKTHYHKGGGGADRFENIYDPNETARRTNFYKQSGENWVPITLEELALN